MDNDDLELRAYRRRMRNKNPSAYIEALESALDALTRRVVVLETVDGLRNQTINLMIDRIEKLENKPDPFALLAAPREWPDRHNL
jgi:hypothetical protein